MEIVVTQNIIAGPNVKASMAVGVAVIDGVAQVRQKDERGRITREGVALLFLKDAKGTEVIIRLTPDEVQEAAVMLPMVAYAAAGVPAPAIEIRSAPTSPILIGGKA